MRVDWLIRIAVEKNFIVCKPQTSTLSRQRHICDEIISNMSDMSVFFPLRQTFCREDFAHLFPEDFPHVIKVALSDEVSTTLFEVT